MANIQYLIKAIEAVGFKYKMGPTTHWGTIGDQTNYFAILFNHDFAKKVWPSDPEDEGSWEFHLESMVTSDEPLRYFEANTDF